MATTAKSRRRPKPPQKPAARKVLTVPSGSGGRPDPPTPLKLVRTARGFTLVQLASRLGCHHSLVSMIENELLTPTPALVGRLCAVLDADADTLGFPGGEVCHVG